MSYCELFDAPVFSISISTFGYYFLQTHFPDVLLSIGSFLRECLSEHLDLAHKFGETPGNCFCSLTPVCAIGGLVLHLSIGGSLLDYTDLLALEEFAIFLQCELRDRIDLSLRTAGYDYPAEVLTHFHVTKSVNLFALL